MIAAQHDLIEITSAELPVLDRGVAGIGRALRTGEISAVEAYRHLEPMLQVLRRDRAPSIEPASGFDPRRYMPSAETNTSPSRGGSDR